MQLRQFILDSYIVSAKLYKAALQPFEKRGKVEFRDFMQVLGRLHKVAQAKAPRFFYVLQDFRNDPLSLQLLMCKI